MNLYKLCESSEHEENKYFLFNDPWSFEWYESWCVNMGGGLAIAENGEHYHAQMDYAEQKIEPLHEACVHSSGSLMIWLGLTDKYEEGAWMNPYTKEPMNYDGNWEHGKTDGGTHENCAISYIDRKWADVDCHKKNCALCHFPNGMNLTINMRNSQQTYPTQKLSTPLGGTHGRSILEFADFLRGRSINYP